MNAKKVDKMIKQLDGAVGRLLVASMKDKTVEQAMRMVSDVSFQLGLLIDDCEDDKEVE